jgi:hypothetical protein
MLTQPTHGGATSIEIAIYSIDFHTATFAGVIEPFATETNTLEFSGQDTPQIPSIHYHAFLRQ